MKLEIERELLQSVFDSAIESMDFGSGFMDDDDVSALRAVAVLLGVDPAVATPTNFVCKYAGGHLWELRAASWNSHFRWLCSRCRAFATGDVMPPTDFPT